MSIDRDLAIELLKARIDALERRIAALEGHPAVSIPPLPVFQPCPSPFPPSGPPYIGDPMPPPSIT